MEGLAAAGGVIAVVGLAGQVLQGCSYLRSVFENADNAPTEVRLLIMELTIIESIIRATSKNDESQDALDFCNEAVAKLRKVVDKYGVLDGVSKCKKWGTRLAMALSSDKIVKHLGRLREAKGYLQHVETISIHNRCLATSNKVLESVNQLSTSHSETTTIISRAEGKLDEIRDINKHTHLALRELASRVVARDNQAMIQDERSISLTKIAVEEILRDLLSEHLSGLVLPDLQHVTNSRPGPGHALEPPVQNTVPFPSAVVGKDLENIRTQRSQLSGLEGWIAELSSAGFGEIGTDEHDDVQRWEKSSKFATRLGEVFMKTICSTYSSTAELLRIALPASWKASSTSTEFPVTITRTDILLLPRNWEQKKGATLWCQHISSPSSFNSEISLHIRRDGYVHATPEECIPCESHGDYGVPDSPRSGSGRSKTQNPSLIMYTAFKVAFMGHNILRPNKDSSSSSLTAWSPIQRNSFDNEVNDALELVHLWLCSGFDAEFYRAAFPIEMVRTRREWEAVSMAQFTRSPPFQRFRLEYTFYLVMEMIATHHEIPSTAHNGGGSYLNSIHEKYWGIFHFTASSWALATTNRLTVKISYAALMHFFDREEVSPYDRDCYGETTLHEAIGMAVMSIEDWWYHTVLSSRLKKALFRPLNPRRLRMYSFICAGHGRNIDELFPKIYSLLGQGLRISETSKEYRAQWGYPRWLGLERPTWEMEFPWKMDNYISNEGSCFVDRLRASIESLDDILVRDFVSAEPVHDTVFGLSTTILAH